MEKFAREELEGVLFEKADHLKYTETKQTAIISKAMVFKIDA